jgi:iron complex transport system substrate-binding protein
VHVAIVLALLLACVSGAPAADKRTVTDSALRRAEVPARIDRVYAAGAPASVLLYTLAPDKMLGWNRPLGAYERAFVPARYADLPTLVVSPAAAIRPTSRRSSARSRT